MYDDEKQRKKMQIQSTLKKIKFYLTSNCNYSCCFVTVHGVKRKDHCPLLRRLDNGLYVLPRGAINNLDPYLANTGGE